MSSSRKYYFTKTCCVSQCKNSIPGKSNFYCFRVPKESNRRNETLRLALRADLISKPVSNIYYICKRHYSSKDIVHGKLKSTALPSRNLPKVARSVQTNAVQETDNATQTNDIFIFVSNDDVQKNLSVVCKEILSLNPTTGNYKIRGEDTTEAKGTTNPIDITDTIIIEDDNDLNENIMIGTNETANEALSVSNDISNGETVAKMKATNDMTVASNPIGPINKRTAMNITDSYVKTLKKNIKIRKDDFLKLCEKYLTKELTEIVRAQINLFLNNNNNSEYRYTQYYLLFCRNVYYTSPQAYRLLQNVLCFPPPSLLIKLCNLLKK